LRQRFARLFFVVTWWLALSANAEPQYYVPEEEPPYGGTAKEAEAANCGGTQIDINICAWRTYRATQKELAEASEKLEAVLRGNKGELRKFRRSQEQWVRTRDSICNVEASEYDGGSMVWLVIYNCRVRENQSRQSEIENAIACAKLSGCKVGPQPIIPPDAAR
jgi:uncharacterized protein YecT (DUF1311 family)